MRQPCPHELLFIILPYARRNVNSKIQLPLQYLSVQAHIVIVVIEMRKLYVFLMNGCILTLTSLLLRAIGLWFTSYISNKIGAEGMGLYTLISSVYTLAVTVAVSGLGLAATRLAAEEQACGHEYGIKNAVKKCMLLGSLCGLTASIFVYCTAEYVALHLLKNAQTLMALKALALSLPFLSVSGILHGYFTAVRRVVKSASAQFTEIAVRIAATAFLLNLFMPKGLDYACLALVLGGAAAEILSFFYILALYYIDILRYKNKKQSPDLTKRIFSIAAPVALSSYLKQGLSTVKHILIPIQLVKSGLSQKRVLEQYGIICGMVMPVLLFPSAIIGAFASLLLPEISQYHIKQEDGRICDIISKIFKTTLLFSICITGILLYWSNDLGMLIYNSAEAGVFIRILAPLVAIIYLDVITDSVLKGMNQQVGVVRINIIDTVTCIILIYFLLPVYGIKGYIGVLFISEILNGVLSVNRLIKSTNFELKFVDWIMKPTAAAALSLLLIHHIDTHQFIFKIVLFCLVYVLALTAAGCLKKRGRARRC